MSSCIWIYSIVLVCLFMPNGSTGLNCNGVNFGRVGCYFNCNCVDNKCDVDGTCIGVPCKKGWSGPTCQKRNIALNSKGINQSPITTRDVSYAIDGNKTTYSETFGDRPYLYLDYGQPTKFDVVEVKYFKTGNRLNLCVTNDIGDIQNRKAFMRKTVYCYDLYMETYSLRSPHVSRYIVLYPGRDQHTFLLVSEIRGQRNNLKSAIVKTKPPSSDHPARLAIDGSTDSYAESTGPDSKLMVNIGRICQLTEIESKLSIPTKARFDMYISNNTNVFDGKDDGLYKKFTKNGTWFSTTKWKVTMDTPILGQYIIFINRGFGNLTIYDIRALELIPPVAAKQSIAQHPFNASLAVDGDNTTFSQTFGMNPYISLDLGNVTAISSVEMDIELKDKDYEFCVSNRSDPVHAIASNDSCWNTTQLNSTWEIQTPGRGRYISLKSPGETFLTLKELKVFACSIGTYGKNCTLQCNKCMNYKCDGITGRCIEGCAAGLIGRNCTVKCPKHCICNGSWEKCDSCEDGWFGEMCSKYCPSICSDGCDQLSGLCTKCKPGLYGKYCNETCHEQCRNGSGCRRESGYCLECKNGLYGNYCDKTCPGGCNQSVCDIKNGSCVQCNIGLFGNNCALNCPNNCNNRGCKKKTGNCKACKLGFAGVRCNVKCNDSSELCKFCSIDAECAFDCPTGCNDNYCNKKTGKCLSCKQNFHGDLCDLACNEQCGSKSCFQNGTCIHCAKGFYGESCLKQCPENCHGGSCDKRSGYCFSCVDGFFGNMCISKFPINCGNDRCETDSMICNSCKQGFYGKTCNISCPKHCDFRGCSMDLGICFGCKSGYYGSQCEKQCPLNCNFKGCSQHDRICYGCKEGYFGDSCRQKCPMNCNIQGCEPTLGYCFGCKHGYFGRYCNKSCPENCNTQGCSLDQGQCIGCKDGKYGNQCNLACPANCKAGQCLQLTGSCYECITGYFGFHCKKACPRNCDRSRCNVNNGNCFKCIEGYYGNKCQMDCQKPCKGSECQSAKKFCNARFFEKSNQEATSGSSTEKETIDYSRILMPTICTIIIGTLFIVAVIITGILCTKRKSSGMYKTFVGEQINNGDFNCSSFDIRNPQSEERL